MLLLKDILSLKEFRDFRIVSGQRGLGNPVLRTGYFEWETGSDISRCFAEGEFVVTTLTAVKDDPERMETFLHTLISCHVAAVAIKDAYVQDVSEEIKALSDQNSVPILFFSDIYIDDILYLVKSELRRNNAREVEGILAELLGTNAPEPDRQLQLIRQIDPYLGDYVVCCAYISLEENTDRLPDMLDRRHRMLSGSSAEPLLHLLPEDLTLRDLSFIWLRYRRGLFYILTAQRQNILPADLLPRLFEQFFPAGGIPGLYRIGLASAKAGLANIRDALLQAQSANISCMLDKVRSLSYEETVFDQILFSSLHQSGSAGLCARMEECVQMAGDTGSYDELSQTLKTYVECSGDTAKAARRLGLDVRTVERQVSRLQETLNCADTFEFHTMASVYVRMLQIQALL